MLLLQLLMLMKLMLLNGPSKHRVMRCHRCGHSPRGRRASPLRHGDKSVPPQSHPHRSGSGASVSKNPSGPRLEAMQR